jgi:hypothetical protein
MRDFQQTRLAILSAATGPDCWRAIDLLPEAPTKDGVLAGTQSEDWAEASFGDLVLGLEYCRLLLQKIADDQFPPLAADSRGKRLVKFGFHSVQSVPALAVAERLNSAAMQLAMRLWRMRDWNLKLGTHPDDTELIQLVPKMQGWADERLLSGVMSSAVPGDWKLVQLQRAAETLTAAAAWAFVQIAVTRWPEPLRGDAAFAMAIELLVRALHLANTERIYAVTRAEVWSRLHQIAVTAGSERAGLERRRMAESLPQEFRNKHVAVLDPSFALSTAVAGLAASSIAALDDADQADRFDASLRNWERVRHRNEEREEDELSKLRELSDLVVPSTGDGVWPASVIEVEKLVRELFASTPQAQWPHSPAPTIGWSGDKLFQVTPPTSIPADLLETQRQQGIHALSPLLAWMAHSSSSQRSVWANHDQAVALLQEGFRDAERRAGLRSLRSDIESVVLPSATSFTVLSLLFPDANALALGILAPAVGPLIKLLKRAI